LTILRPDFFNYLGQKKVLAELYLQALFLFNQCAVLWIIPAMRVLRGVKIHHYAKA
jgi:hypothetical protein